MISERDYFNDFFPDDLQSRDVKQLESALTQIIEQSAVSRRYTPQGQAEIVSRWLFVVEKELAQLSDEAIFQAFTQSLNALEQYYQLHDSGGQLQ